MTDPKPSLPARAPVATDDDDSVVTFAPAGERAFTHWRADADRWRHPGMVRREQGSDDCTRRVIVTVEDGKLFTIQTYRDQWGTWIEGQDPNGDRLWIVAQEDGTPSFLFAFIEALTWLREDDWGTPRDQETRP